MNKPDFFSFNALGTFWKITVFESLGTVGLKEIQNQVFFRAKEFDENFSRFKSSSFIRQITKKSGRLIVPEDLVNMLRIYEKLYCPSGKKLNPLIGNLLSDLGYDEAYTLIPKVKLRKVPDFIEHIHIIDNKTINLGGNFLIDLGALGKGYLIDKIYDYLVAQGLKRFLVDGSGDIRYKGLGKTISVGLEHPEDFSKVIGVLEMNEGALCSSSGNKRKWGKYHHIIDPQKMSSPKEILSTWVFSDSAVLSDALATALFFSPPENYVSICTFEYCILNKDMKIKRSKGFKAELF